MQIEIAEAEARLSALVDAAERGEDVVITRDGAPVVRIAPIAHGAASRIGMADGELARRPHPPKSMADDGLLSRN